MCRSAITWFIFNEQNITNKYERTSDAGAPEVFLISWTLCRWNHFCWTAMRIIYTLEERGALGPDIYRVSQKKRSLATCAQVDPTWQSTGRPKKNFPSEFSGQYQFWAFWANLGKSGHSGQIWANLGKSGQIWANLGILGKSGHFGQFWANLAILGKSGVYWSGGYPAPGLQRFF